MKEKKINSLALGARLFVGEGVQPPEGLLPPPPFVLVLVGFLELVVGLGLALVFRAS